MRVSQEILIGLKRVGNSSLLNEDSLDKILTEISSYLEFSLNPNHSLEISADTPKIDILKECFASLLTFLVEGIRWNEDPSVLQSLLKAQNVPEARVEKILEIYTRQKLPLRLSLNQFNSDPPHIFDATWKMHFCVKSSFSDFDSKEVYFIQLTVGKKTGLFSNETETINFVCTINQLQSLVTTLKAATRHLESIAER